jgi:hypothetical protein
VGAIPANTLLPKAKLPRFDLPDWTAEKIREVGAAESLPQRQKYAAVFSSSC